jgi:hypothetical protein
MKVSTSVRFFLPLVALLLFTSGVVRAQDARAALSNFPESQAVLYINARRLINEAAPSVVPPDALNKALADAKQFIDLNGLDYVIAGARVKGELSLKQLPEVLLIVRGNFSADGLLSAARMAGQGMYAQETYGGKTLNVFTLNKPAPADGGSAPPAKKFPVDQIAATALDANTLAIGIPAYLRDAIDASGGGGDRARLKPELVDLAMSDANTLVSFVTDVPPAMSQHLRALGMPPNAEVDKMIDALRQVQWSINMQPSLFGTQMTLRMEGAEQASALSGLVNMGVRFLEGEIQKEVTKTGGKDDKAVGALHMLKSLTNTARGNDVILNVTFQQEALAAIIRKEMMPSKKPQTAITPAPGANKGAAVKRRRGRARRR